MFFLGAVLLNCTTFGHGQNTEPQSKDYPDGLPRWTTLKWTTPKKILFRMSTIEGTAIYILTLRPLAAILNNNTL